MVDDQLVVHVGLGHADYVGHGDGADRDLAAELGLDPGAILGFDFILARPDRGARQRAGAGADQRAAPVLPIA